QEPRSLDRVGRPDERHDRAVGRGPGIDVEEQGTRRPADLGGDRIDHRPGTALAEAGNALDELPGAHCTEWPVEWRKCRPATRPALSRTSSASRRERESRSWPLRRATTRRS